MAVAALTLVAAPTKAAGPSERAEQPPAEVAQPTAPRPGARTLDINEYAVRGVTRLSTLEVESVLEPFLGPGRALEDVERARAALEKAYSDRGWQAVSVSIPPQTVRDGVVILDATEGKVARLRVRGAHWFSLTDIKRQAPSVAEGAVPNFNEVIRDIFVMNQLPDRRVTPSLRAGAIPGTMDVDLNVEDRLPLHGSLEVNDRSSASTTPTRLHGALRYDNLWQSGHSLSFSFQTAPQRRRDGEVFAASYLARFPTVTWLSVSASAILQDSDVSTLGDIAVTGRGRILGGRATFTLPAPAAWFHTLAVGVDYKRFLQGIASQSYPITYWPATAQYSASWRGEASEMQIGATVAVNFRALSSSPVQFDDNRYGSSGSFILYRGEVGRTDELPFGIQLFERVVGQYSADPLIGSEQLTAGGIESVRGYLEAQAVGDVGTTGQLEVRSPSLSRWFGKRFVDEWRFLAFADAGWLGVHDALTDQKGEFVLWSAGGGSRFKLLDHVAGAVDVGVPLRSVGATRRFGPRVHFRVWSEF